MFILAPQSGALSIKNVKNKYQIVISIPKGRYINLLLEKPKTSLKVKPNTQVKQRQLIAQTDSSAIFYISTKDGKDLVLCLGDISAKIPIIKNLSLENCN